MLFLSGQITGQAYKFIYYMDENLTTVRKDKALITGKGYEKEGAVVVDCYLNATNQLVLSASFTDSTLGELKGLFQTYYEGGWPESEGSYEKNLMSGVWKYWDKNGFLTDSMIYRNGIRIAYGHYDYYFITLKLKHLLSADSLRNAMYLSKYSFTDSLANTFIEKEISYKEGKPRLNFEAFFTDQKGILKEYDSTGNVKIDSVFERTLREAEFRGGQHEWIRFLGKNLNSSVLEDNRAPDGKYTVVVKFIVDVNGALYDIEAENDPGYGAAKEAVRVIKLSPKWVPAKMYGRLVRAYRRQPITLMIENN